jgi:hypothetical protein
MNKIITLAAAVAVLALSCGDEEGVTPPPGPDRLEPTSPASVIENVEISFNQHDVDPLKRVLGPDFVFYFDPDDVGQNPPGKPYKIPESWSYTEFWTALRSMFQKAYSIKLSIPTSRVGTPSPSQTTYKAENVSISLVVMVDENNGYQADQGYCNFAFESYTSEAGKKCWRLTKWWDRTSVGLDAAPGVEPTSFGRILATFK